MISHREIIATILQSFLSLSYERAPKRFQLHGCLIKKAETFCSGTQMLVSTETRIDILRTKQTFWMPIIKIWTIRQTLLKFCSGRSLLFPTV